MKNVIRFHDKPDALVETSRFPYATFPFAKLNQVQSGLFDVYDKDANFCIAAATSAGKTVCAEMVLSHEVRQRGGIGMYIGPLRALAQEKIDDWSDKKHHFADLNQSICTGDYVLTEARKKELDRANTIVMTSEMLASRCRNMKSEKNNFLQRVGTIVVDEAHLLTVPDRGAHLEVALMKLTDLNPNIRVMLLSATLPNVNEVCGWTSTLTNKPTYLVESEYRPCPLTLHYPTYFDGNRDYEDNEAEKVDAALHIVRSFPKDKFLIFAHTKRTGEMMKMVLKTQGIDSEFHKSDLEKEKRIKLVENFKDRAGLRVLIATSGLAWGLNTPARRVILLGIHRGMGIVENYDIKQMVGRAGRPAYDPAGDAYILLPQKNFEAARERLDTPTYIESQLLDKPTESGFNRYKTLAFHIVSEIHHGGVRDKKDLYKWYSRSLAHYQAKDMDEEIASTVLDSLKKCGAVKEEEEKLATTTTGTIASMFYYNPFDVSDLKKNFSLLFKAGKEGNDVFTSMCLANIDSYRFGIVSKTEREEMGSFAGKVKGMMGSDIEEAAIKMGFCYFSLMSGHRNEAVQAIMRNLQFDFGRTAQVLTMLDQMGAKWGRQEYLKKLRMRVQKGVPENLVYLAEVDNIGVVRAQRLFDAGFRTAADLVKDQDAARRVLKLSKMSDKSIDTVLEDARAVRYRELLGES
jgi:helicase